MGLLDKWLDSLEYHYSVLGSCSRAISPHSSCDQCISYCKDGAISLENSVPVIDMDKCTKCGGCIPACPVQAIAGILPLRTISSNKLVITPGHKPSKKELLIYHKKGITEIICNEKVVPIEWDTSIKESNLALKELEAEPFTIIFEETTEDHLKSLSRRELFSLWKTEGRGLATALTPAQWRFNHMETNLSKHFPDYQFFDLAINPDSCTLCKACITLCTRQALIQEGDQFILKAHQCSGCGLCVDICPEKSISFAESIKTKENVELPIHFKHCSKCGTEFPTLRNTDEKCFICFKKEKQTLFGYL